MWPLLRPEQPGAIHEACALRVGHREAASLVRRRAGEAPVLGQRVECQVEVRPTAAVEESRLRQGNYALHHLEQRLLGRHPAPHELDGEEGPADLDIGLPASGGPGRADSVVAVLARPDDRAVAHPAGDLPRDTARRRDRAEITPRIHRVHVDGARREWNAGGVIALEPGVGCLIAGWWATSTTGGRRDQPVVRTAAARFPP